MPFEIELNNNIYSFLNGFITFKFINGWCLMKNDTATFYRRCAHEVQKGNQITTDKWTAKTWCWIIPEHWILFQIIYCIQRWKHFIIRAKNQSIGIAHTDSEVSWKCKSFCKWDRRDFNYCHPGCWVNIVILINSISKMLYVSHKNNATGNCSIHGRAILLIDFSFYLFSIC